MEGNVMESQMDEHLTNLQREIKTALERFKASGIKMDKKFVNYFQKLSVDRVTQTCERYTAEAKYKPQGEITNTQTASADAHDINLNETSNDNSSQKRASEDNNIDVQAKKQRLEPNPCDKSIVYFCAYCRSHTNPYLSVTGSIDEVYEHWLFNHADEGLKMPFQFCAVALLSCYYCDEVSVYDKLVKHHKKMHPDQCFVIANRINRNKCGICNHEDIDMVQHSKKNHDLNATPKVFNPVFYPEETISQLLSIRIQKKQNQCPHCYRAFESSAKVAEHRIKFHPDQLSMPDISLDNQNAPIHLVCGFCKQTIDCKQLLGHFREHKYNFCCSKCPYKSDDMAELVCHEKTTHNVDSLNYHSSIFPGWIKNKFFNTDMAFSNGLLLKMYNVQQTKFDDSKLFDMFVDGYLEMKKERAAELIELKKANLATESEQTSPIQSVQIEYISSASSTVASMPKELQQRITALDATPVNTAQSAASVSESNPTLTSVKSDELLQRIELSKQRQLEKNVYIRGIPRDVNDNKLMSIAMTLFKRLGVSVSKANVKHLCKDVSRISNGAVIVKLAKKDLPMQIIGRMMGKTIWSNELMVWNNIRSPSKISIHQHFTPYYFDLWKNASNLRKKGLLYSYKLISKGFTVQRTKTSTEQVIMSKQQLMDYVKRN